MNDEEFKKDLKTRRKTMSEKEYFELLFELLEGNFSQEILNTIRSQLLVYSFIDNDRVALYLEPFLNDPDPFQREVAALHLFIASNEPNSLGHKILARHLGEESIEGQELDLILERFQKLFPMQDNDG